MRTMFNGWRVVRFSAAIAGAALAVAISTVDARQGQAPAPQTPQPTAPAQGQPAGQNQQPAARNNAAAPGAVRNAEGAIIGFTALAEIPGTPWRIHDIARPHPRVITPGATPGAAPSDAIVLFDGKDLSKWQHSRNGQVSDATWPVKEGYFETGAGSGSIVTREKFGDVQLHVEFATPSPGRGSSQDRGNSGVTFMGRYEVQVLDSYENVTYADGQAAAIYGEYPPLVNVARKPGEWQTYDIVFEAPKFNGPTLARSCLHHRVLERRPRPASTAGHGLDVRDDDAARLHAARSRTAADAAGSLASGSLSQYLDPKTGGVRFAGGEVAFSRFAVRGSRFAVRGSDARSAGLQLRVLAGNQEPAATKRTF